MLEKIDLNKKMSKQEYSESLPKIEAELGRLQRECKDLDIPVMIVFEGFGASGKGLQIGKLIHSMDPRGFEVHTIKNETEEERMHPFLWRFWIKTPEKGKIAVFDGSWYRKVWVDRFEKRTREKELKDDFASINAFEQQLSEGGTLIIKLFLDIDQDEQEKRFKKLEKKKETQWRVTQGDKERNVKYDEYALMAEEMLFCTDTDYAPWTIIEATDRRFATTLKLAKGYRGARSKQYRVAKQSVMRALTSAYAGRKQRKRQMRQLWIARINAAARMNDLSYSKFMHGLKLANVDINRKMLAELAVNDKEGFATLAALAKEKLA